MNGVLASVIGAKSPSRVFDCELQPGEADPEQGRVLMDEGLAAHPMDEAFASPIPAAVDTRKQRFAQMLETKVAQGYEIESQSDTEAVLFMRGRRSWFGLFAGRGAGARQIISIDDQGAANTHKLSANETSESGRNGTPVTG